MAQLEGQQRKMSDVIVVGAALNGAAAALAFAKAGFSCVAMGAPADVGAGRTVALFDRSLELLRQIGVWEKAQARAAPLRRLRLIDDTGSLFAPRPVEFNSREIGLDAFGWNIDNATLLGLIAAELDAHPGVVRISSPAARFAFAGEDASVTADSGEAFAGRLIVGADGRASPTRQAAGVRTRSHTYPQKALTLLLAHSRPHDDVSTEFHTREGPFTLVPLPASAAAAHRSSLVWLMSDAAAERRAGLDDDALAREIERQSRGLLGSVRIETARGLFPMTRQYATGLTAPRMALIGDAAHVYPPIGAQGLNLGLRDVDDLLSVAVRARDRGDDIGAAATLAAYARARAPDIAERMLVVNGLNVSLLSHAAPVDALRGLGLAALAHIAPLRRLAMREGLSPQWAR